MWRDVKEVIEKRYKNGTKASIRNGFGMFKKKKEKKKQYELPKVF